MRCIPGSCLCVLGTHLKILLSRLKKNGWLALPLLPWITYKAYKLSPLWAWLCYSWTVLCVIIIWHDNVPSAVFNHQSNKTNKFTYLICLALFSLIFIILARYPMMDLYFQSSPISETPINFQYFPAVMHIYLWSLIVTVWNIWTI